MAALKDKTLRVSVMSADLLYRCFALSHRAAALLVAPCFRGHRAHPQYTLPQQARHEERTGRIQPCSPTLGLQVDVRPGLTALTFVQVIGLSTCGSSRIRCRCRSGNDRDGRGTPSGPSQVS